MAGEKIRNLGVEAPPIHRHEVPYVSVKAAVLPFIKFPGTDTLLGPEMRSTGEVMGIDKEYSNAFAKSQLAAGHLLPNPGCAFVSVADVDKENVLPLARRLYACGFKLVATGGTKRFLESNGVYAERINKVNEGTPSILDKIEEGQIQLVINTTVGAQSIQDSKSLRRASVNKGLPYYTTVSGAAAAVDAIEAINNLDAYQVASLQQRLESNARPNR